MAMERDAVTCALRLDGYSVNGSVEYFLPDVDLIQLAMGFAHAFICKVRSHEDRVDSRTCTCARHSAARARFCITSSFFPVVFGRVE